MLDAEKLTDTELGETLDALREEYSRRQNLTQAFEAAPELVGAFMDQTGREMGEKWKQPLGEFDSYPEGWVAVENGVEWVSTIEHNVWKPGESGWKPLVVEGENPPWVQPTGSHDAYSEGDKVLHKGETFESLVDNNVWEPGAVGSEGLWDLVVTETVEEEK